MNQYSHFAIEKTDVIRPQSVVDPDQWKLLRRLHLPNKFNEPQKGPIKRAIVIDVETTGLSIENDDVLQLAMLPFDYEVESGRILTVHKALAFEGLREPAVPISEEASLITGITDDMVAGKSIDGAAVAAVVAEADLVIAHNAYFDRPMVERHWDCFAEKPWACTLDSVDWLREGFSAGKLDYLGMQFGWFYDGHQALADCEACLALLAQTLPKSGKRVMSVVREVALRDDYLVRAVDAPYDLRDKLKQRGYRWRPAELKNGKVWWTMTSDPEAEIAWLQAEVYGQEVKVPVLPITACKRFSNRTWEFEQSGAQGRSVAILSSRHRDQLLKLCRQRHKGDCANAMKEQAMETWFVKSVFATVCIVPAFLAIPFFKSKFGIDPLVFLVWYFGATAVSIGVFWLLSGRAAELIPSTPQLLTIIAIGVVFGALANGFLFQAIGMAPNPGLPPVIYATSSMIVFILSVSLASTFPELFKPVSTELTRMAGIVLVVAGLYLLAGGKLPMVS